MLRKVSIGSRGSGGGSKIMGTYFGRLRVGSARQQGGSWPVNILLACHSRPV